MAKKTFKQESPAEAFITMDSKKEIKNGRFNLMVYPRLKADLDKIAFVYQTSVNDTMNKAFEEYIENHKDALDAYYKMEAIRSELTKRKSKKESVDEIPFNL